MTGPGRGDRAGIAQDDVGEERGLVGAGRGHDQQVFFERDAQLVLVVGPAEEHRVLAWVYDPPPDRELRADAAAMAFMNTLAATEARFSARARSARRPCKARATPRQAKTRAAASGMAASSAATAGGWRVALTIRYWNPRELHQTGAFVLVAW